MSSTPNNKSRIVMERIIATATLLVAFTVMASIFVPGESEAGNHGKEHETGHDTHGGHSSAGEADAGHDKATGSGHDHLSESAASTDAHAGLDTLGVIEGLSYHVHVYSTDAGVRYSIADAKTGEMLGTLLSLEQIRRLFPEAPVRNTDFSAPGEADSGPVGYVDDHAGGPMTGP